ncbi:MAG TPA: hypothetical protein VFZ20_29070 [Longimicrobium sp.]|nr:hypothetical protein [Longimicrobium sp.]
MKARIATPTVEAVHEAEMDALGLNPAERERLRARGASARWREEWERFVAEMADGDELWAFESPPETWADLAGTAGYTVVRDGAPVAVLISRRS